MAQILSESTVSTLIPFADREAFLEFIDGQIDGVTVSDFPGINGEIVFSVWVIMRPRMYWVIRTLSRLERRYGSIARSHR